MTKNELTQFLSYKWPKQPSVGKIIPVKGCGKFIKLQKKIKTVN